MNNYAYFLVALCMIVECCFCMDGQIIKVMTSDNKEFILPQWKIEESRLLHTKQQWQLFKEKYDRVSVTPIQLKTICSQKLELFSQALDARDFSQHFNGLTHDRKCLLLCAAGEQELDSSILTAQLVDCCFNQEFINRHLKCGLEIKKMVNALRNNAIMATVATKKFPQETLSFKDSYETKFGRMNSFISVPKCLMKKGKYVFDGDSTVFPITTFENKQWQLGYQQKRDNNIYYHLTSDIPVNNPQLSQFVEFSNKCLLWTTDEHNNVIYKKIIRHMQQIKRPRFSPNARYLITASDRTLILTKLGIKKDGSDFCDIIIEEKQGEIACTRFNPQSTLLAVGLENEDDNLHMYDTQTGKLLCNLPGHKGRIFSVQFNTDGSRMISISWSDTDGARIFFWDTSDFHQITLINGFEANVSVLLNMHSNFRGDRFVCDGFRDEICLFDANGKLIKCERRKNRFRDLLSGSSIFTPDDRFLITASLAEKTSNGNTILWDARDGVLISTLLENQKGVRGVGLTPDKRYVVTTFEDMTMIKTALFGQDVSDCLSWLKRSSSFFQLYALYRAHKNTKKCDLERHELDSNPFVCSTLRALPIEPCNVKELVGKYLLEKTR